MKYELESLFNIMHAYDIYDFNFTSVVQEVLDRIENPNQDEDIFQAIDDSLIYYDDQWLILKHYCQPQESDWIYAIDEFTELIFSVSAQLSKE